MIKLHQFPPAYGLPNASPFCLKVETYLRMTGIPFEVVEDFDLGKAPKGKMPYIEDDGHPIADSGMVIDYLKTTYGDILDAHLNDQAKAASLAFTRLMDEHLYWSQVYVRWVEHEGWKRTQREFFGSLNAPWRQIVPHLARRAMKKQLWGHGMGRHSPQEIFALANADITALSHYLGDQTYFHGQAPSTLDAVAYAHLVNILWAPFDSPVKRYAVALSNLEVFCARVRDQYFSETPSQVAVLCPRSLG